MEKALNNAERMITERMIVGRAFIFCFLSLLFVLPSEAQQTKIIGDYTKRVLSNGMTVYLLEQRELPIVSFTVMVATGSISDPPGKEGLASVATELLWRGTRARSAEDISYQLDYVGADLSQFVDLEYSGHGVQFLAKDREPVLALVVDCLSGATFPKKELALSLKQRVASLVRSKDDPSQLVDEYLYAFLFRDHPYGRPSDGDERSLERISQSDLVRFYQEHYFPENLTLSVVGDFESNDMFEALEKVFSSWQAKKNAGGRKIVETPQPVKKTKLLLVNKRDSPEAFFMVGSVGVSFSNPDRFGLEVVNTALGGKFTSALNKVLRVDFGLTYGVGSAFRRYQQPGPFLVSSSAKTESTVTALLLTLETLKKFRKQGVSAEQLQAAKAYLMGQFPLRFETIDSLGQAMSTLHYYGVSPSDLNSYLGRFQAVTIAEAQRLAAQYLSEEQVAIVVIGNADQLKPELEKIWSNIELKDIKSPGFSL